MGSIQSKALLKLASPVQLDAIPVLIAVTVSDMSIAPYAFQVLLMLNWELMIILRNKWSVDVQQEFTQIQPLILV
jgi:hypothetical protein